MVLFIDINTDMAYGHDYWNNIIDAVLSLHMDMYIDMTFGCVIWFSVQMRVKTVVISYSSLL